MNQEPTANRFKEETHDVDSWVGSVFVVFAFNKKQQNSNGP